MRVVIGADHAGFELKGPVVDYLKSQGHTPIDVGTYSTDAVDYPDSARAVAEKLRAKEADLGIMVCGSGVGGCIAVNKFPGIRAAVCHDVFSAHQGVEDDDMNVLCLGPRVIGRNLAMDLVKTVLTAKFSGLGRHQRRLDKVNAIEREFCK